MCGAEVLSPAQLLNHPELAKGWSEKFFAPEWRAVTRRLSEGATRALITFWCRPLLDRRLGQLS